MHTTEPFPPQVPRSDALGRLRRELRLAQDVGETRLAQDLQNRIDRLCARSTSTSPQRETTAAATPRRETTGAKPANHRSPRVPRQ
ncbi:hypothetical protein [Streptacidiphilus albus]|uniref:hypothetical protein n=1 Tax=Streptacidiphilus albus TaxID=105425 RepID=UPI00054B8072|nr:hypothetical protein [Streptacidiphilus albus]